MVRVVFDTNVLYSALLKPTGKEARAFDLVTENLIIPCVSPAVLTEYYAVLFRPALRKHEKRAIEVLDIFMSVAVQVTPTTVLRISEDESDNRIYECAAAADADYIVTGNTKHFKEGYGHIRIVNAGQLLAVLAP